MPFLDDVLKSALKAATPQGHVAPTAPSPIPTPLDFMPFEFRPPVAAAPAGITLGLPEIQNVSRIYGELEALKTARPIHERAWTAGYDAGRIPIPAPGLGPVPPSYTVGQVALLCLACLGVGYWIRGRMTA